MSATDSQLTNMEDQYAVQDQEGRLTDAPSPGPPSLPNTARPSFGSDTEIENKALSMASHHCSSALSSPAEASPAKPALTSPTTLEGSIDTSPSTSRIASASDSLTHKGSSFVDVEALPLAENLLPAEFGCPDPAKDFPSVLTFKGVSVTLENNSVWKQFHSYGTEMIITKQGRRMFPYCRYRLSGLDPNRGYNLVLSIVPSDQQRYRWNSTKWEATGEVEHKAKSIIRAFSHQHSPYRGSEGMNGLVSFYKLKLTNHTQDDDDGHIVLQSMHRYIPRLHIIPIPNLDEFRPDQSLVVGLEGMTFTFPQTEFMAVTTYQNFRITQLKINHNPFAKGFREDGNNSRLQRVAPALNVADKDDSKVVDLRIKKESAASSPPKEQETRLILKPFTFSPNSQDESLTRYSRGGHSLGVLVLVKKPPVEEPKEEDGEVEVTPNKQQCNRQSPKTPSASTPRSSPGLRKRRKKMKRHWGNSRAREWKAAAASPSAAHSPSAVAMQPELDHVEGLLFVSFPSKEDLEIHVKDMPANTVSSPPPASLTAQIDLKEAEAEVAGSGEERAAGLEVELLRDLKVLRHRQVIHPVLQEVGLKLSLLDPFKSVDLHYLGVRLPLPPPERPSRGSADAAAAAAAAACPADEGLPYISRTGKTSDMTKIKGWRNKFVKSQEAPPSNPDGSQKNLSAFCSNMLDEYLENEARQISERADAFSANPEAPVAYQLPAKSSSYVKTLDSVLRHRHAASKAPAAANRPCPLSHKPPSYATSTSASPPQMQPGPEPEPSRSSSSTPQSSTWSRKTASSFGHGLYVRNHGNSKCHIKMMDMESGVLQQGFHRTLLSAERLSAALTSVLTKEMLSKQVANRHVKPKGVAASPACAQVFCRLGCVCLSIKSSKVERLHCCHSECMFDSTCLRTQSPQQPNQHIQPAAVNSGLKQNVQPRPRSNSKKLWNPKMTDVDPDPLFVPKCSEIAQAPAKPSARSNVPHINQPIREEDKDPVYKYFESMMTCARVRPYNGRPPPETPEEPSDTETSTPNPPDPKSEAMESLPKKYRVVLYGSEAGNDIHTKKQIEIQSACQWEADSTVVISDLCKRLDQNRLSKKFCVGPYLIQPITRIAIKRAAGSSVTFRVHICKKPLASDGDDDNDSEEVFSDDGSFHEDLDAEEEEEEEEEQRMQYGILPFLSRVLPAGRLTAKRKPVGCQATGLIQVNRKSYNHARLLLGRMGSLHPANRLAAYVTGRLGAPSRLPHKPAERPPSPHGAASAAGPRVKTVAAAAPAIIPSEEAADVKMSVQPPVGLPQQASLTKGFLSFPSRPQSLEWPSPTFPPNRSRLGSLFRSSSVPSPVSFSVSPSLKTPNFLGDSGTYSFRICPPDSQGKGGHRLPGVALPGGFTLIHLPRPSADGASRTRQGNAGASGRGGRWPENVRGPTEKTVGATATGSRRDSLSEDEASDSSDYSDSGDSIVDIETVKQEEQEIEVKKEPEESPRNRNNSVNQPVIIMDVGYKIEDYLKTRRHAQVKHSELERRRRSEQRLRFDKLQHLMKCDDKIPRLHLLELTVEEVKKLSDTNKELVETKRRLTVMQETYVKQLSLLSGKPEQLIKDKLQSICEGEKAGEKLSKFRPFSQLLQFRAAILQSSVNQPSVPAAPLLPPDVFLPQFQSDVSDGASNPEAGQAPARTSAPAPAPAHTSLPPPSGGLFSSQSKVATPPAQAVTHNHALNRLQAINQHHFNKPLSAQQQSASSPRHKSTPEGPILPTVLSAIARSTLETLMKSKAMAAAAARPSAAHNAAPPPPSKLLKGPATSPSLSKTTSPKSSSPKHPRPSLPKPLHLPLVRSKTGRLILPSSLKPVGKGQLKLMFLDSQSPGGQPNHTLSDDNREKGADSEGGADKERGHAEEGDPQKPSLLVTLQTTGNQTLGLIQDPETTIAKSKPAKPVAVPPAQPHSSPTVECRPRGRPRKSPVSPLNQTEKLTAQRDMSANESGSESSALAETGDSSEEITLEVSRTQVKEEGAPQATEAQGQVPVKRGRGRPPKKNSAKFAHAGDRAAKRRKDRSSPDFTIPNSKSLLNHRKTSPLQISASSRPLTRGALGKDFPSAKKRSWVDMEKELESL